MLVMNPEAFVLREWCGSSFHWNASLSESSLWHQKWLLSHLSAKQGLKCYYSYVWFLRNFPNSLFQLLWISLSIFTCHFEEWKSFATLFTDGKCCWKDEDKETDLGIYYFLHFSKTQSFTIPCLPVYLWIVARKLSISFYTACRFSAALWKKQA